MNALLNVALFLESSGVYGRGVLHGVARYVRGHSPWNLHVVMGTAEDASPLIGWQGDGLIARARSMAARETVLRFSGCTIMFEEGQSPPSAKRASISDGHFEAAVLAIEDFRQRGYRQAAFVKFPDRRGGNGLDQPFLKACADADLPSYIYDPTGLADATPAVQQQHLARWLSALPRPIAIWCASDLRGLDVTAACRLADLRVPEEFAILGHNNDELVCELSNPPLSSIRVPYERMGYHAAELLDRMMGGEISPDHTVIFPPTGIVVRRSTDIVAVDDADLADAIRFIRIHATEGIGVDDVVGAVNLSRSTLQRRFRNVMGRTPAEEIERVKIDRAKELLAFTRLPMPEVARRSGYAYPPRLAEAFKRLLQISPSAYRTKFSPPL